MQILLTGSGTLIGNNLARYLSKKNLKLICSYRKNYPNNISKNLKIKIIKIDLEKKIKIKDSFDILIHCAAAIPDYNLSKQKMFKINIDGFKKLLEISKKNRCKKIILLSTTSVYGKPKKLILDENYKGYHVDNYGRSKLKMESMLKEFCEENKCSGTVLRMPGVLGKNSQHNFLSNLKNSIINKKHSFIFNPNFKFNNAIHIDDLCSIVYQSLSNKKFKIYNIGSKYPLKLKKIVHLMINKIYGKNSKNLVTFKNSNQKGFRLNIKRALEAKYSLNNTQETILNFLNDR